MVFADEAMRWLDVVVRTRRASGRVLGRTEEKCVRRVSVVELDGRGKHIVGRDAHPAKVVRRTLVVVILVRQALSQKWCRYRGCPVARKSKILRKQIAYVAVANSRCDGGFVKQ